VTIFFIKISSLNLLQNTETSANVKIKKLRMIFYTHTQIIN